MPIPLIDKIKPKNNGNFALVDAIDVEYKSGRLTDYLPVFLTQEEYDAMKAAGELNANTPYFIRKEEELDE